MDFKRGIDPKEALGIGIKEQNKNSTRLFRNLEEFFKKEWDIPILSYIPYINFIDDDERYKMPSFDMSLSLPEALKLRKNSYRKKKLRKWFDDNTIWYILKIKYTGENINFKARRIGEFKITLR